MDPRKLFLDKRLKGTCFYCGMTSPDTRDHIPSKVLLEKPYPKNLSVVECCLKCNNKFSLDEEYLACFLECVIHGTSIPNDLFRSKASKILTHKPNLQSQIFNSKSIGANGITWAPEQERIKKIVIKLARGHLSFALGNNYLSIPTSIDIIPIPFLTEDQLHNYNQVHNFKSELVPELGSRAFFDTIISNSNDTDISISNSNNGWNIVQKNMYRLSFDYTYGSWVKIVLREYLACTLKWN